MSATSVGAVHVIVALDDQQLDDLVRLLTPRIAVALTSRASTEPAADRYVSPKGAADYLGVSRKRIYDLTSAGALTPDGRDGRTPLFRLSTLDRYVQS